MKKLQIYSYPLQYSSGYTIDLYCKYKHENISEFTHQVIYDEDKKEAWKIAKNAGWIIHKDRTATCPYCAKKLKEK